MNWTIKCLLLIASLNAGVNCRSLRQITSYGNEQTFYGKRIIFGTGHIITDSESYVYAACTTQESIFQQNLCNVVVETPSFANAVYKDTCSVHLDTNSKNLYITHLKLYPFGDDKVLLSWRVEKSINDLIHTINVRILKMSNCQYYEVVLEADKFLDLVPYPSEGNFDLMFSGNKTCKHETCRITYDSSGKQVGRPRQFLPNHSELVKILSLEPVTAGSPIKGFYALIQATKYKPDQVQILQVDADGQGGKANSNNSFVSNNFVTSNTYDRFTVCWACDRTNITCWQYDPKLNLQLNVVLGFLDEPGFGTPRWMKIHNVREGGFLMITGPRDNSDERKFNVFSIMRVHANGRRDRPLEIKDLGFECTSIDSLLVDVSENDEEEVCVHIACNRAHFGNDGTRSTLKYSTKCLHKSYVSPAQHKASVVN